MEILRIFCLLAFLNLRSAQEIPCNVTQSSQGTLYSVPEFQASGCHYQWANASGHVLANHKVKISDLVLNSSVRSIVTHTCMPQLNYTRDCISEGIQRVTYCVTYCMTPEPLRGEEMHRYYWGMIISFSITALVVVVVLLRSICSVFIGRNNPPSTDNVGAPHT